MPRILNPFFITVNPNTTTSSEFITGSADALSFYYPTSSFSNSLITGSLGSIGFNFETINTASGVGGQMVFTVPNTNNTPNTGSVILSLGHSGSNNEPRVGIGFDISSGEKPIKPFDIRTKSDTNEGTEILLRSGRITQGAQPGDTVGTINFTAESSSFNKFGQIALSGSVATISAIVRTIDEDGASGDIIFSTTSTGSKSNPAGEVMRLTGEGNISVTGSINVTDDRGISGQDFQLGGSGADRGKLTVRSIKQDDALYTNTFAGNVSIGTTLISHPLRVNGDSFLDGNVQLGTTQADLIDVQGRATFDESVFLNDVVYVSNLQSTIYNPPNDGGNVLIVDNGQMRSSSVDNRIFTNAINESLISKTVLGGDANHIGIFTGDTPPTLTSSANFAYNSSANIFSAAGTLTVSPALGFISTPFTATGNLTTQASLFASLSFASGSHDNVVVYNPTSDKFYYTGSYSSPQGTQGLQGLQGIMGLQGPKGNPGLGLQGVQGTAAVPSTNISASGHISASAILVENNLAIGGITNVSASIYSAAQSGGSGTTPTLQQVTNEGASTTTAITASIISASGTITTAGSLITTKTGSVTDPALLIGANSGFSSGNNTGIILDPLIPGTTFYVPYFVANGNKIFGFGSIMQMEAAIDMQSNKLYFDSDQANTYIASNADDPEDLEIHADQDVILNPDGQVIANSNISASGALTVNSIIETSRTRIKILPRDFVADDVGRPLMIEDDNLGSGEAFLHSFGSANAYAYVEIPTGYTATHIKISGSDASQTYTPYEGNIGSSTVVAKGSATNINTELNITDVAATDSNYLMIQVTSDGSDDKIFGGYVTITPS